MNMSDVLKWIAIARVVLPMTLTMAGVPQQHIPGIVDAAADAETALGPGSGSDKLAAVQKGVADVMSASGAAPEHIVAVNDMVSAGLSTGIKAVNDIHTLKTDPAPSL